MSLIVNSTNIPTNGSFAFFNTTDLDIIMCNGVEVWRKIVETDFIDGPDIMDGYTFSWVGNNDNKIGQYAASYNKFELVNGYYRISTALADDYKLGYSSIVTSTVKWSNINVSGFNKLILDYKIKGECSDDATLYLNTHIKCGSLSSEVLSGTATKPWSANGSTNKPYIVEGTLELDISSLSGEQLIQIVQVHNNPRGYDANMRQAYVTWSYTDIISFRLE